MYGQITGPEIKECKMNENDFNWFDKVWAVIVRT